MRTRTCHRFSFLLAGLVLISGVWLLTARSVQAGGPLLVGGPNFGVEGQAFIWDPAAMPIQYRVDGGPLSSKPDGTVVTDNAAGLARVQAMFQVWQDVPTAAISYANAGPIQSVGVFTDGDVSTAEEFDAVGASCDDGTQSPIVFDADGRVVDQVIGDPNVIGFSSTCRLDATTGRIVSALVLMNGRYQDGIDAGDSYPPNDEMTAAEFGEALAHEFGHFSGLDHSQINIDVLQQAAGACLLSELTTLPLMFPFAQCQARSKAGLPVLAPDDVAWISRLYPETADSPPTKIPFGSKYGTISGAILFSDGVTHAQGVNVIARDASRPFAVAVSVVSGYLFTGNPGQNLTGTNDAGSSFGSRNPLLVGTYDIPVPAGAYKIEVESIFEGFEGGSGVGPLSPPIPNPGQNEFWNVGESATDSVALSSPVSVTAGAVVNEINITLNGTPERFDSFESARLWWLEPLPAWVRENEFALDVVNG